ncbi:hypothetical protein ABC347_07920 [Sphingomonas sp. 1P06PA]|uniref:hypothetical protein n=1 Tax=Sphingomonas sp. 1P06PA TaxID=554121 RepID=UPI0039A6E5EA
MATSPSPPPTFSYEDARRLKRECLGDPRDHKAVIDCQRETQAMIDMIWKASFASLRSGSLGLTECHGDPLRRVA